MKKLIFSLFFVFTLALFVVPFANALPEFSGTWSMGGNSFSVSQSGNTVKFSGKEGGFTGKITGNTVVGQQYIVAKGCPNLNKFVSANGTVSNDGSSIYVKAIWPQYDTDNCTDLPGTDKEHTLTYTKTGPQNSPTPQPSASSFPTPTETPLDLNGTWTTVNEVGTFFRFSGRHSGNSLTMQITDASDVKDSIGKTSLSGTLSGHAFSGTQILIPYAPKCLGNYFYTDGAGTVAADGSSITVSYTSFKYNGDTCARIPGTEFASSITYIRANAGPKPTSGKNAKQASPTPEITETPEEPSVGVSSTDFRALARANAEFQEAQAVLDKIKADKDQRFEDKRDFANQLQDALQKYPEEQQDTLQIIRDRLEEVKSDAELYQKAKDFADWVKGSDLDTDSGGIGVVITVGNGLNDFLDLKNDGVSTDDAVAKVLIDSIAVDINPFVKTADMIATLPDEIMAAIGIPPNHWSRKPTVYLHDNSPSAFVGLTTDAMIKSHSWENVGGAIQVAWEDVKSADGFGEKAQAMVDLVGTAVGAVPVAIAMQARDTISTIFDVVKAGGVTNFLIDQFWLPD